MTDPHREPNPDSLPQEYDRGSIEQIDDPRDPREEPGVEDLPTDPEDRGVVREPL